ncbi:MULTISPECIES: lipopolysaccharide biosynthesis protein [Niastella]|uniref:Oligosaccharide flippase family protein n=1 Tax=Niastella soli TaxID=2821487 RepID=A0ABS3Z025_9BACT|nr:oligosaccharide flippase family protein [Niastella soli]MBO9203526.1 oligosaccharide flippase family protein [Niastella soli]
MSIRRQSIISSLLVYVGLALGLLNTYLYAKGFSEAQYGLIGAFQAFATVMFSFSNVGITYYIYKFYPYYKDNLPPDKNDMITLALLTSLVSFSFVVISGLVFKDFVILKYSAHSPEVIHYYYWLFPFGFGLSIYSILEAFAWQLRKSVFTNFIKEILWRLFATILIVLLFLKVIRDFDLFIKIYAFTYIGIAATLMGYLVVTRQLHFTFSISRVTKKFYKKIVSIGLFIWTSFMVVNISSVFDTLVIAAVVKNGMKFVGIYTLAQNMSSLVFAPQRAISSAALAPLSQAWKDKDLGRINRIYQRSSINQLIFGIAIFLLIWINFTDGVLTFHLKQGYLDARIVFLFIGLTKVIDMGTGLNSQIIGTSSYWKVETISGVILLLLTLPLNYLLTLQLQELGPAIANLFAIIVYNAIRYFFLLKKFKLQPFTPQTLYSLLLGTACYAICFLLFNAQQGFGWIVLRSSVFVLLYATGVLYFKLSPDVLPVWDTVKKRLMLKKG